MCENSRDKGMTLPELLIAVTLMGVIAAVLSASIVVTLRQQDNTEGRLNVARFEQNVSMWVPADLASADSVDTNPWASPCGAAVCGGVDLSQGSNVLMLSWTLEDVNGNEMTTRVSYHFRPDGPDSETFSLIRVKCDNDGCASNPILRDLPGPTVGTFEPGVGIGAAECTSRLENPDATNCSRPTWVIQVSEPQNPCEGLNGPELAACLSDTGTDGSTKNAKRVIVTINGGGDGDGAGGGLNQISITAGGTTRTAIDAGSLLNAPTFVETRSRCGGPMTLIVDESLSITTPTNYSSQVKNAVRTFAEALQGTPVQLQVIGFGTRSAVLGAGSTEWHKYVDMRDDTAVSSLMSAISAIQFTDNASDPTGGDTNWEDALFRTFRTDQDTRPSDANFPNTVVFFTDGVPTADRTSTGSKDFIAPNGSADAVVPAEPAVQAPPYGPYRAGVFSTESFNRAEVVATRFGQQVERMIAVGVGGVNDAQHFVTDPNQWQRLRSGGSWRTSDTQSGTWQSYDASSVPASVKVDANNPSDGYRQVGVSRTGNDLLKRMLPDVVPAQKVTSGGQTVYTNAAVANYYQLGSSSADWNGLTAALQAAALGSCGGTLTLQTKHGDGSPARDPFRYQNSAAWNAEGDPLTVEQSVVTTSAQFSSGTFDFPLTAGTGQKVEIRPQNYAELSAYSPGTWSCRAGPHTRAVETFALPDAPAGWTGIRVDVMANEAVSCTLTVSL